MSLLELFLLAVGLAMDAFAVSVCKGLSVSKIKPFHPLCAGLWFGGFQALMPFIGYLLGIRFQELITNIDHWIAFILLALIGANMIREALSKEEDEEESCDSSFGAKSMFVLAIATSIDALAVGITFAFLNVSIGPAVGFIGIVTFFLSAVGILVGHFFGSRYKSKAELFGGIVLILIGLKILLEHLGILG